MQEELVVFQQFQMPVKMSQLWVEVSKITKEDNFLYCLIHSTENTKSRTLAEVMEHLVNSKDP